MTSMRQGFLFLFLSLFAFIAFGQTDVQVSKTGNDVMLTWSGGTSPFDVIKDTVPYFSTNPDMLLSGSSNTDYTDTGALINGIYLEFYRVADATKPTISITSTTPPSPTTTRTVQVDGTYSTADYIYVNETSANFAAGGFGANPIRLFIGDNTITATATDSIGNVAFDQVTVTRDEGNVPPEIYFIPADDTAIYDDTPELKVCFCYSEPADDLVIGSLFIQLDGTDKSTSFTSSSPPTGCPDVNKCYLYTFPVTPPLSNGHHFLSATIKDSWDYYSNGSSNFLLSNPIIDTLTPDEGTTGTSVTIDGNGFDPTDVNNSVKFDAEDATVTSASATQLIVTVPDTATQGPVTVTVNGRTSNAVDFKVLIDDVLLDASAITYEDANGSLWVADRDYPSNQDNIWEYVPPGTSWQKINRPNSNIPFVSKDFDSSQNIYYCNGLYNTANQGSIWYINTSNSSTFFRAAGAASSDPVYCHGLAVPSNVNNLVFFLDGNNGTVRRVPSGGLIDQIYGDEAFNFNNPAGAILIDSTDLVVSEMTAIKKILPDETVVTLDTGYTGAAGIDWDGTHILVADQGTNKVTLFDPTDASTQKWTLAENLTSPRAVAFGGTEEIYVLEQSSFFLLPKPTISLQAWDGSGNYPIPTKIYADYDPLFGIDSPGVQFIVLEVNTSPLTLISNDCPDPYPAKVTWIIEDPDDPSDDENIDPNFGSGDDNVVTIGTYTSPEQWQQYASYTMDEGASSNNLIVHTKIIDGISRVVLNMSGYPGENFKVTAQITIPVFNTIQAETPVFTIWKKLWVELDSMGECQGPMDDDDDDAVCFDIPQPDITFLANAFKSAYVDVFDAGQATPDTDFKYHLSNNEEYFVQGQIGRQAPDSSAGYWEVEIQGSYEDSTILDNDPDGSNNRLGTFYQITSTNAWAFSYHETIRDIAAYANIDDYYLNRRDVLHEFGHFFRLADGSGGIMGTLPDTEPKKTIFTNCQIKIIRRCVEYPGPFVFIPQSETCTITCP